mgnify:CR=1
MTVVQASTLLTCSILFMLSILVIVGFSLLINNLIHKYWKSFGWKFFPAYIQKDENK